MRVAVVHNALAPGETDPSTLDVLAQAEHIRDALADKGHTAKILPLGRDIASHLADLRRFKADVVFNLVESVDNLAALHPAAAAVWELAGVPHTGSPADALHVATDKALAKSRMQASGIPTPEWALCERGGKSSAWRVVPGPWFLKPALEDASLGIEEDSVVRAASAMPRRIRALQEKFQQPVLVERYIDGREFNLSVLAGPNGPQALPPAEMVFVDYPPGKERVLGFRSKWDPEAFEYNHTVRRFRFGREDAPLLRALKAAALRCWRVFGLRGYARVDFRVDQHNSIYVLEINTNPCLSPDAGFAAAVAEAGLSRAEMAQRILEDAVWLPGQSR